MVEDFSMQLKKLRHRLNLPQAVVAKRALMTVTTVSSLERGLSFPGLDTLMKIMMAMRVSPGTKFEFSMAGGDFTLTYKGKTQQ